MAQTSAMPSQGKPQLNFNFGIAAFEVVIGENFRSIQDTLAKQQAQINRLTSVFEGFQKNINTIPKQTHQKESIESAKMAENASSPTDIRSIIEEKAQKKQQQTINSPQKPTQAKQITHQTQGNNTIVSTIPVLQGENAMLPQQSQLNQTDLSISEVEVKMVNSDIMEEKVFELFQRVRQLEEKQSNSERFNLKKLREVDFQIQEASQSIQKSRKAMEQFDDTVQTLRNQISEYKLKKESKIMKALNSSSINLNQTYSGGDNYDYMADKLQFLLKHVSQLMTKRSFEDQREIIHQSIDNIRKKMNDNINETFFKQSLKAQQARIYQSMAKHIKALQFSPHEKSTSDELDSIIQEGNRQFLQRVNEHEQRIKVITEEITLLKSAVDGNRKERVQFQEECSDQIRLTQQKCEMLGMQIEDTHKYIQEVKQSLSQKQLQSENQIIQLQESLDKVTSNFKTLAFAVNNKDNLLRTSYTPNDNPESQPALQKTGSNIELQNDLKSQQKKFNKLLGKVQGLKEDILLFREDLMREIDGLKAGIEKKADWESLKKGLNYFEEKLKQTKAVTQALYEGTGKEEGDSLAVKKGWTCLVCDKDIKSYEGKLGELKFTSMFPVRESPRIGGYYKQQQANQEYRQVFLSNSNLNNRNRRIGSLKSKQSKEELH